MATKLPKEVITEDRKLQAAGPSLGELRWHWTKDESNPERVTIRQYSTAVGANEHAVGRYVRAWDSWRNVLGPAHSWDEHLERIQASTGQQAVLDAVAAEEGVSFTTARGKRKDLVKKTKATAEARAEKNDTSIEAEAAGAARDVVGMDRANRAEREAKAKRVGIRAQGAAVSIERAKQELREVRTLLTDVEFDAEILTELGEDLIGVRSILADCLALTGQHDLDAELKEVQS